MHALALAFVLASYGGPYAEHVVSGRGVLDLPQTAQVRHIVFGLADGAWIVNDSLLVASVDGAVAFTIRSVSPTILGRQ